MRKSRFAFGNVLAALLCLACLLAPVAARAQSEPTPGPQSEAARAAEASAAWKAGYDAGTKGPADIVLIDQASLKIPADYLFIPKAEGVRIMRALGNTVNEATFVGLVGGLKASESWLVVARYIKKATSRTTTPRIGTPTSCCRISRTAPRRRTRTVLRAAFARWRSSAGCKSRLTIPTPIA